MVRPWSRSPWWVLALVMGGLFGVSMTVFGIIQGLPVLAAALGGVISGAIFAPAMAWWAVRYRRAEAAAVGRMPEADHRTLERAVPGAPVPADPALLAAAARLTEHRLGQLERQRRWSLPLFAVGSVLYAVAAVVSSPWWWPAAAFFAAMAVVGVLLPRHLRRRLAVLSRTAPR